MLTPVVTFWATFGKNRAIFNSASCHSDHDDATCLLLLPIKLFENGKVSSKIHYLREKLSSLSSVGNVSKLFPASGVLSEGHR